MIAVVVLIPVVIRLFYPGFDTNVSSACAGSVAHLRPWALWRIRHGAITHGHGVAVLQRCSVGLEYPSHNETAAW